MQIRSKAYLQFMLLWRSICDWLPPHGRDGLTETSPALIYIAVVLTFLLAILEIDAHRAELQSAGLSANDYPVEAAFLSP
jgi:hypothetical protein